jgi:hypothetical protein
MFAVPASSLPFATRRDPFAVSFTTLRDLCRLEFPLPASGLSFEQKSGRARSAKPRESCQALQNQHLQKSSRNSREMNTYKIIRLKVEQNEHLQKNVGGAGPSALILLRSRRIVP